MKLGFKTDVGAKEQEDNNESYEVDTLWVFDSFPIPAVTNYHKFSSIKGCKFILLQFWRPQVQNHFTKLKSECGQGWFLSEALGENLFL